MEQTAHEFAPHPVVWTREKSQRWWDASTSRQGFQHQYFSRLAGDLLLRVLRSARVSLEGRVLDFGCGPGYLLEKLAAKGVDCHGIDFSPESVDKARDRLREQGTAATVELARGIPTHLEERSYDAVFFLETLEHLLEEERAPTVAELSRILRPGGTLIVTVPNQEDLDRAQVLCPDCGCQFHTMQHVSSWSSASVAALMDEHGFETVKTRELFLHSRHVLARVQTIASTLQRKAAPNLVYIGRRTQRYGGAPHDPRLLRGEP